MARLPRLSVPGLPHLVEHGGHNRQPVFKDEADRQAFRDLLREAAAAAPVAIHAYALGECRVLLLATPAEPGALSRMMQGLARRYTVWFNKRHGRGGTLWAGRFGATVIDPDTELVAAMRHIESDAVLSGDAAAPRERRWSSAAHHLGVDHDPIVSDHLRFWALGNTPFERHAAYRDVVGQPLGEAERRRFDEAARKGWALGSDRFLESLGQLCGRRAVPRRPGRPRVRAVAGQHDQSVPD
jgi:putative transposase